MERDDDDDTIMVAATWDLGSNVVVAELWTTARELETVMNDDTFDMHPIKNISRAFADNDRDNMAPPF